MTPFPADNDDVPPKNNRRLRLVDEKGLPLISGFPLKMTKDIEYIIQFAVVALRSQR